MSANWIPPSGGGTLPAIFQTSTHADQIGFNDSPANNQGFFSSGVWHLPGSATVYVATPADLNIGLTVYTHLLQTDRFYDGTDVRSHKGGIGSHVDIDNNDPSYNPSSGVSYGITTYTRVGVNGPSYGTCHGLSSTVNVLNQGSALNEYACLFMAMLGGTYDNHLIAGGDFWFTDWGLHGPIGVQPRLLNGVSLVTNNYYNGSPSGGLSAGMALQSLRAAGPGFETHCVGEIASNTQATIYPMDVGYFVGGIATGGTGDAFTNAIQVGSSVGVWGPPTGNQAWGGDQGQVGRGVVVKAKNAGTSCARLGSFVSEGTGEGGGLVFGLDTNDANRASISRPSNGVMTLRGKVSFANGGYAASTTATPTNVVGKIAIYNDSGTLLGYLPLYGSL
jgi:hypothetical protein